MHHHSLDDGALHGKASNSREQHGVYFGIVLGLIVMAITTALPPLSAVEVDGDGSLE